MIRIPRHPAKEGDKFNHLVVVGESSPKLYKGRWEPAYILQCSCGNLARVGHNRLKETQSCGCLLGWSVRTGDNARLGWGQSFLNRLFRQYRRNAKIKGREFLLSKDEFKDLITTNCHYCKRLPNDVWERADPNQQKDRHYGKFRYNGVDRLDSQLGYTRENSLPCCKTCNRMKNDFTTEEFRNHIQMLFREWAA